MPVKNLNKFKLILTSTSHGVTDLYASFIIGLIPVLASKFELSLFMISILTSVTSISNSLTQPLFGFLSDKFGARNFLIAGPLLASIFISMLGIAPSYWIIVIFLFVGNLSISAFHPPSASMASYFGGNKKGFGNAFISFGGTVGYSLGSIFVILIVEKLGLSFTPIAMIPGVITAIILFKYLPKDISIKHSKDTRLFLRLKNMKKKRLVSFFLLFLASFSRDLTWIMLLTFLPIYFTDLGIGLTSIGYIIMANGLLGGIGGLLAGYYSDRLKNKHYLIQAGLILSIPLIFFIFRTSNLGAIILFVFSGFFLISTLPLCIRLSQQLFPRDVSLASSLVMGLSVGSSAIAMIFIGRVADIIGISTTVSYSLILILVASISLFFLPVFNRKS